MRRRQNSPPPVDAPSDDPPVDAPDDPPVDARIVQRPDGYHWLAADGKREIGPFSTFEEAEFDLHADEHSDVEPEETLAEAEREIGMTDWIDPETGEPAEQERPRIEDH